MRQLEIRFTVILAIALAILATLSLIAGAVSLSVSEVLTGLLESDTASAVIVREIRLPRLILAITTGAVLGMAGAAAQSLTRNPLAEPTLFGTPQAAAFGAVLVLHSGLASASSPLTSFTAIAFALLSLVAILYFARTGRSTLSTLLAGLGLGSLAGAGVSAVLGFSSNPYAIIDIVFWLMGSFEDRSLQQAYFAVPFSLLAIILFFSCRRGFQAMTLGDEVAETLGVNVKLVAFKTVLGIAIGVGAGVAVAGAIGFVGLVAPHIIRKAYGNDPGRILLPSALVGAIILLSADIIVRLLPSNGELRIGVLTALIGAPLFIFLLTKNRLSP